MCVGDGVRSKISGFVGTRQPNGRLRLLRILKREGHKTRCVVVCDCGKENTIALWRFTAQDTRSCGCLRNEALNEHRSSWRDPPPSPGTKQITGRLTLLRMTKSDSHRRCAAVCSCGVETVLSLSEFLSEKTKSCGCLAAELLRKRSTTHGETAMKSGNMRRRVSVEYDTWNHIRDRCHNPRNPGYYKYGAKGIRVCQRWLDSFEAFLQDMGRRPSNEHSIDRKNNKLGYEPDNCRWATRKQQMNNRANTVWIGCGGLTLTLSDWAHVMDMPYTTLWARLNGKKWTVSRALTTPKRAY